MFAGEAEAMLAMATKEGSQIFGRGRQRVTSDCFKSRVTLAYVICDATRVRRKIRAGGWGLEVTTEHTLMVLL